MYCVKFCDRLRRKFGNFADTTDYADVTDNGKTGKQKQTKAPKASSVVRSDRHGSFYASCLVLENDSAQSMIAPDLSVLSV